MIEIGVLDPAAPSVTDRLVVVWPLMLTVALPSCGIAVTVTLPTSLVTLTV
jgi:hypothetical protein